MIIIGLTGSIASGKSTVSNILRERPYSLPIIDADVLARKVVEPGTYGYRKIVAYFGPSTPDLLSAPNTEITLKEMRPINRAALGRRVFGSDESHVKDRKILNGIVHPLVRLAIVREMLYYHFLGHWAVILDIPLLFESALDVFCSVVVMVAVSSPEVQMERLRERDSALSEEEATSRVGSQMSVQEKVARTKARSKQRGKVIFNDTSRSDLQHAIARVVQELHNEGRGTLWTLWLWGSPFGVLLVSAWEILCARTARTGFCRQSIHQDAKP